MSSENDSKAMNAEPEEQEQNGAGGRPTSQIQDTMKQHKPYQGSGVFGEDEDTTTRSQRRHYGGKTDSNIFGV
ncbi:hypothetical protein JTE90_009241 [Oedothorax gibbosus]|uniref:Uncharacterized protein n=1 Tax=Oedothorax gibbosus TaxID=931172 RepID=A0AAV6UQB7_9ARAC|nr:hypothetical protein JTE90_009241 [Oedothorax gibbosus]